MSSINLPRKALETRDVRGKMSENVIGKF